ncbi:putative lipid II flippase FtsW [Ghiorsea bivora]|uniref:putative lipid II flippase FtsW n=1 Tax=Ghiorsea bivora TaxID=1485545 RepID=UPI00056DB1FD|nr:putative lipid II flippase FtsW [Ghiorsea bivora]
MVKVSRLPMDPMLLLSVVALLSFSLIMVGSASLDVADVRYGSPWHILVRWCFYIPVGLVVMWLVSRIQPSWWEVLVLPMLLLGFVLLVAVLLLGNSINGATRWFSVLGMTVQPIELIKPVFIMYIAYYLANFPDRLQSFAQGIMPMLLMLSMMVGLLLAQPDFGNAVLLLTVSFCLWFVGGVPFRHLLGLFLAAVPLLAVIVMAAPYRLARLTSFVDPWADRFGSGYQLVQSQIAFGVGGVTGAGLGQGVQKLFYLPESFTDFISAVIGEELGLVGILSLILVFAMLCWRGFMIAKHAVKPFERLLALGCTLLLALAFIINLGAAMGIFPTKGMPMPFISYGGSALIGACILVGLIFSVQRHQPVKASNKRVRRSEQVKHQEVTA